MPPIEDPDARCVPKRSLEGDVMYRCYRKGGPPKNGSREGDGSPEEKRIGEVGSRPRMEWVPAGVDICGQWSFRMGSAADDGQVSRRTPERVVSGSAQGKRQPQAGQSTSSMAR